MNRRQFTASLGALSGAVTVPLPAVVTPMTSPAIPPMAYSWAKLIIRAQAKADPVMLARHLRLAPEVAQALVDTLIRDGVLQVRGAAGIAKAVQPIQSSAHSATTHKALHHRLHTHVLKGSEPLVKDNTPALDCAGNVEKEAADASPPEPVQESSRQR